MTKQKHYFKQKIYLPDPLANRSIYIEGCTIGVRNRHQDLIKQAQESGKTVPEKVLRRLKNHEERARAMANKAFSTRIWAELQKQRMLSR